MKKLEKIQKKLILILLREDGIREYTFENSYNNKGLLSVRVGDIRYYCKESEDYHSTFDYALVNNLDKIKESRETLISKKISQLMGDVDTYESALIKVRGRLKKLKEL